MREFLKKTIPREDILCSSKRRKCRRGLPQSRVRTLRGRHCPGRTAALGGRRAGGERGEVESASSIPRVLWQLSSERHCRKQEDVRASVHPSDQGSPSPGRGPVSPAARWGPGRTAGERCVRSEAPPASAAASARQALGSLVPQRLGTAALGRSLYKHTLAERLQGKGSDAPRVRGRDGLTNDGRRGRHCPDREGELSAVGVSGGTGAQRERLGRGDSSVQSLS